MKLWNKFYLNFFTVILFFVGFLTGYIKYLFYIYLLVLVHEFGHVVISLILKRKITKIEILPFGGLTKIDSHISENIFEDLLIGVGGIFFQTISGFILIILYNIGVIEYDTFNFLNKYNIIIMLFNLIPICPLDGYKLLKLFTELILPFKFTFIVTRIISIILIGFILIFKFNLVLDNTLIFIFMIYMMIEEVKNEKYIIFRFYVERLNYNFKYPRKNINNYKEMFKNRINYIDNVHEKVFLKDLFTSK